MVQLANAILKERGIGDELNPDDLPALVESLGLRADVLERVQSDMDQVASDLDVLASSLAS